MAEPEAVRLQGPSYTCGTTTTTATNFPHRRHYAVRRKLGRAKTARLTAPLPSADTGDDDGPVSADSQLSTATKEATSTDTANDKCHSDLNYSTECDDDEESDDEDLEEEEESVTTTEDNEASVEADDEEDDNESRTASG